MMIINHPYHNVIVLTHMHLTPKAVLTKKDNVKSVVAALIVGFLIVLLLQPFILGDFTEAIIGKSIEIAWPWWTVIGGSISFGICCLGKRR
ncbi:MAG: hypothetical protein ACOX19_01115 [Fermentimonas sp.]|jgi:SSS family solute:Na+ symporter